MLAPVKVNLTLHVGPVRADGYHPIASLCVSPMIGDRVEIGPKARDFSLLIDGPFAGDLSGLPPEKNLAMRAARLLAAKTTLTPRRLRLTKTVPAAAGIAGGTADAAAVLVGLNAVADAPLTDERLIALSRRLGADGPVCTSAVLAGGGAWLVGGDGDAVRQTPAPGDLWLVLSNPGQPISTPTVFAAFDRAGSARPLATEPVPAPTARGFARAARAGRNDLRAPAVALCPAIDAVEDALRAAPGCLFARMSGSGATVFGLFSSAAAAARAAKREQAAGRWAAAGPLRA